MTQKPKLRFRFILLLLIIGICISIPFILQEYDALRLKLLTRKIAGTDRIVASGRLSPVTLTLTGDNAEKIVRAVSSATASRPGIGKEDACSYADTATFLKGTNVLEHIQMCGSSFLIHSRRPHYIDESKLLETLLAHPLAEAVNDAAMKEYELKKK